MQNSIVLIGLGVRGATFVFNYKESKPINNYFLSDIRLISKHIADPVKKVELKKLVKETTNDIYRNIAKYNTAIIVCALGDNSGSILLPSLAKKLIKAGKSCFFFGTIPFQTEVNDEWKYAKKTAIQLESILPEKHCSLLDVNVFRENIIGEVSEIFYASLASSFFKGETDYLLKYGTLYRVFDLEDEIYTEDSIAVVKKLSDFTFEELLERLNGLWRKRIKTSNPYDEDREESENIVIEIRERGYVIIEEEYFVTTLLPAIEPDEKRDALLGKIRAQKSKIIEENKYEDAARLRDMEKRLMNEIAIPYFEGNTDDYFLLLDNVDKTIVYRFCKAGIWDEFIKKICQVR